MAFGDDVFSTVPERDYDDARAEIRSGDILLCSGKHPFSILIQQATDSIWSHVAFVLRLDAIDRIMVLESVEGIGVRTVPLSAYVRGSPAKPKGYDGRLLIARHAAFDAAVSQDALNRMSCFAVDRFGYPYDNDEIAKIAARITLGALGRKIPKKIKPDNEFICSEYAARCYAEVGVEMQWNPRGFIAPSDFAADPQVRAVCALKTEPYRPST